MDENRKNNLYRKLNHLSEEISGKRLSFAKTMSVLTSVLAATSAGVTIMADGHNAVVQIMQLIGHDKESEELAVQRLTPPLRALPPPVGKQPSLPKPREELDDNIPF